MILDGGLILQALAGGGSSGGKVKPITITENGTYNVSDAEKAEGYVGFGPVTVDVPQSSGFLTLEQLAALPTACSLSYGDYRTDVKVHADNTLGYIESGNPTYAQYNINVRYNYGMLCKVVSKNNVPFYGAYSTFNMFWNQWAYVYDTESGIIHKVNLSEWELVEASATAQPRQYGANEIGLSLTYKYKYTYYDSATDEQTGTDEQTNSTSSTIYAVGNNVVSNGYGYAAPSTASLYPSIAAELCRAEKAFYETFKT